jgi:diguanylate cyclase (GGDEF)-like protein/PAS domain S-box-containing protein
MPDDSAADAADPRDDARFLRAVLETISDLVLVIDAAGHLRYANAAAMRVLDIPPDDCIGATFLDLVHPDDTQAALEAFAAVTDGGRSTRESVVLRVRAAHGRWLHLETAVSNLVDDRVARGFVLNARDVTERVDADGSIRVLEAITTDLRAEPSVRGLVTDARDVTDRIVAERRAEQLSEVLERSDDIVVLAEPSGRLVYANQRARAFVGFEPRFVVDALIASESLERLRAETLPFVRQHGLWTGELTLRTPSGDSIVTIATVQAHREHGEVTLFSMSAHDITDLKRTQVRLEYEAAHDPLTGLPNRTMFHEVGEQALARAARSGATTAVLFLDLDGFKNVNDSLGHDTGDHVLAELGRRLRSGVRDGDLVARLGGDEFCVVCEQVAGEQEARDVGRRLRENVAAPLAVRGREVQVGASIGIALDHGGHTTIGELIGEADAALYRAKRRGVDGSRIEVYDAEAEVESPPEG